MLDPWLIEKLREQEAERQRREAEQRQHATVVTWDAPAQTPPPRQETPRGVCVIDL